MQQNLVGTNLVFNNVGQIVSSNNPNQQHIIQNTALSNSGIKQRYQNQSNNMDETQKTEFSDKKNNYYKRAPNNPQMVSAGNTVTSGQLITGTDNMNKEKWTVKQMTRKIPSGQNLMGTSGSHGSSQSFHGTSNMTMQLNSFISMGMVP